MHGRWRQRRRENVVVGEGWEREAEKNNSGKILQVPEGQKWGKTCTKIEKIRELNKL